MAFHFLPPLRSRQIHRGGAGCANLAAPIAVFGCTDATLIVD
jgi:hypothetical protein